jgi:hypothetical protein
MFVLATAGGAAATLDAKPARIASSTEDSVSRDAPVKTIRKGASTGVRTLAASACVTAGISCNTTVSGELTADDCPYGDGSFFDEWTFQGTAGQTVQITMQASFDTYIELDDPDGFLLEDNNDYPGLGTNSRIMITLTEAGQYTIRANSLGANITGPYTLQLICAQGGPCAASATTLCLNNGRFRVQAIFSAPSLGITNAPAQVEPLTSDTGYFWFFSSNNVEIVLKVVDGRAFNNFFWVFYGALSDVQYTITVTDTLTGALKAYPNTQGHLASVADTAAFPGSGAAATGAAGAAKAPASSSSSIDAIVQAESTGIIGLLSPSTPQACTSNATTLCLNNGRFQVRAIFSAPSLGITNAPAQAEPLTSDTGYFWFFSSNNVEIVIKAVDGRAFNNFFWVFYGALSDVEYTITVTDTVNGTVKTYPNSPGHLASIADTAAFPP